MRTRGSPAGLQPNVRNSWTAMESVAMNHRSCPLSWWIYFTADRFHPLTRLPHGRKMAGRMQSVRTDSFYSKLYTAILDKTPATTGTLDTVNLPINAPDEYEHSSTRPLIFRSTKRSDNSSLFIQRYSRIFGHLVSWRLTSFLSSSTQSQRAIEADIYYIINVANGNCAAQSDDTDQAPVFTTNDLENWGSQVSHDTRVWLNLRLKASYVVVRHAYQAGRVQNPQ